MKRLFALVLSFCLILSCLPFGAMALEADKEIKAEPQIASEEEIQAPQKVLEQVVETAPVVNEATHAGHGACICAVKGASCGHTALTWSAWESTTSLPTAAGNYYLTGKVTLSAVTTISANVNICLNGFDVDLNQKRIVVSGGSLTIMNCQATLNSKGQLTSTAGRVYNGASTNNSNSGINYMGGAIGTKAPLTLIAIHLDNNLCKQSSDARSGGAIYAEHTTVIMESCSFKDNKSDGTGGVFASYGGSLTVKDCLFTNNHAVKRGGAIAVNTSGASGATNLTITGNSEFTGNKVTSTGGTVFYGAGGAIFVFKNGTTALNVTLSGNTKITGNTASQEGGGLCVRNKTASSATNLTISGNVQIYGNAGEQTYDNVYFDNSAADSAQKITVGDLDASANVKVNLKSAVADPDAALAAASGAAFDEKATIGVYVEDKAVAYNTTDLFYYPGHAHQACVCAITGDDCGDHGNAAIWSAWESTTSLPTEPGNYYLTGKVTLSGNVIINGKVNLCLNGFDVDMNEKHIESGSGDDLTILNCQATLNAKGQLEAGNAKITNGKHTHGSVAYVAVGGKLTAIGVEFSKNNNYRSGTIYDGQGGGALYTEGQLKVYACRFVENTTNNHGGAIAQYVNGSVYIDDCYFSGNTAAKHGGAVSGFSGSATTASPVITITGDTEITGNSATGNGGALYTFRHSGTKADYTVRLVINGNTKITGNNAKIGGGVYMNAKSTTVEVAGNVQITGNTGSTKAPNVYLWDLNTHKLVVGNLGASASIGIFTGDNFTTAADEPDGYLQLASGVTMADKEDTGLFWDRSDPAKTIGYNSTDKFYYVTAPVVAHKHGACICAVSGASCSHEELTWTAWESTTSLPTEAGNYYLTDKVTVAANVMPVGKVNICLNGFSIDMNEKRIEAGSGDDVTILNCQATLNAKGQLEAGNAKIYNGKHTHGAAVNVPKGGKFTAIGVEFADNNNYRDNPPTGQGGGAVYIEGAAELYACRFVDNTSNNCGGAIAVYVTGSAKVDDCYFSGNSAVSGGAISVYTGGSSVSDVVATLTGDNEFTGNEANNGGALNIRRHANTPASYTAKIILEDNCIITGNNAKNNGGAIYFDSAKAALEIRDNVVITDNTAGGKGPNVYLWDLTHKITVGQLGSGISVGVFTGDNFAAEDPDEFMQLASGVTMADTEDTGFFFEKTDPDLVIGYNSTEKFYFVDNTVYEHDDHGMCICAITKASCSHSKLTWKPWKSKTSLPTTAGNYFLTADVTLSALTDISADVNICLNGYNINLNGKKIHNTASLGIMNCQATLNDKNQLTSTTGKIYGGDGTSNSAQLYGGAISTFGALKLIGVWFADNTAKGADARTGGALYVDDKAVVTIESCKFSGNKALSDSTTNKNKGVGGAISVYKGGSLDITDTVFADNIADLYGGAICVNNRYATADSAITINGNCEFTGNKVNSTTDGFGSALYLYARGEDGGKLAVHIGGNTKITGNTAAKFGAVYLRTHDKASAPLEFVLADNVNICDNEASTEQAANIYMQTMAQKVQVGQLGNSFRAFVGTPSGVGDPDEFMVEAGGVKLQDMDVTGFFYANKSPAISVGHSTDDDVDFYFDMAAAQAHTDHSLCDCFLGGKACEDASLTWKAWIYDDQLPTTAGNWYLTSDVKVTDVTNVKVAGVNLCLNGYSIDLNEKYINISGAGEMAVINCKAVAKSNGQLDGTKSVGGKITGGKHTHGAAFSIAKGADLTAIGVEFYKNNNYREGTVYEGQGGGAIHSEGVVALYSCRFIENTTNNCGGAMTLYSTGSATINDCYFSGNTAAKQGGALSFYTGGSTTANVTLTFTGENDFVGNTAEGSGGAIYIKRHSNTAENINPKLETKGTVKMTENTAVKDGGGIAIVGTTTDFRVDLNGVKISKNKANRGGGIFAEQVNLVGTTITVSKNSAEGTNSAGGGIVGMGAIITLQTDTTVTGNKTEKGGGGGIYVSNASTVNLYGCTVTKNESPDGGGIRLWRESVLNLKGGKINQNKSTASGGGVSLVKGSILNMEDGEINKNTCEKNGGGIYCDNYFQSTDQDYELPQLNLIGGTISGNTINGSYGAGVYAKNCHTKISGTVISKNIGKTANGGGIYASKVKVNEETEVNGETVITTYEFEPTFEMTGGEISENKTKNGGGIYFNEVNATISGGVIKKNTAAENAGGISVRTAKLTFKNGAEVSNNTGKSGGGIILQVDSTMDMLGGSIKGNSARNGGGILLWSRSVLNMRSGRVNSNKATKGSGGGIFAQGGAQVKLSGGTIGYNTAKANGGGIYVTVLDKDTRIARFTQTGGVVVGNEGNQGGGGYLNKGAIANIYGGTWKENKTTVCGGAMYVNSSTANFYGGTFTKNHATDCGGAINAKASKVLVDGAEFVENISEARGGAFRIHTDTEFIVKSGKINNNEAARGGGAIGLFNCKVVNIEGGEICGNKVVGSELYPDPIGGGAINVAEAGNVYSQYDSEINITGGKIADNYSMTDGGAIFLCSRAVLNFSGGEIVNNSAGENGGAITIDPIHSNSRTARATLNMTGGKLSGNTAKLNGGAIYAVTTSKVVLDGATIEGNTASEMGGAVYMGKGTNTTFKDTLLRNNKAANAAGFYVADDFVLQNLEVTGNDAGSGYAAYIDKGEFDGRSYVLSIIKMGGDIRICDNHGENADLFIGEDAKINVAKEGLGKNTKINLELASGVLTNTIIGAYNYEGGNRLYTVTYGDRSMTDLEPIPTDPAEQQEEIPATEPVVVEQVEGSTSIIMPIVLGVAALAVVLAVLIFIVNNKNKKKNNRKG